MTSFSIVTSKDGYAFKMYAFFLSLMAENLSGRVNG